MKEFDRWACPGARTSGTERGSPRQEESYFPETSTLWKETLQVQEVSDLCTASKEKCSLVGRVSTEVSARRGLEI